MKNVLLISALLLISHQSSISSQSIVNKKNRVNGIEISSSQNSEFKPAEIVAKNIVNDDLGNDNDEDAQVNYDFDESSNSRNPIDIEELNPRENKCIVEKVSNRTLLKCGKIPLFCRDVCDRIKSIYFNEQVKRIRPFALGSYKIKNTLELNFDQSLKRIESDSLNGLLIESDQILELNFGSFSAAKFDNNLNSVDELTDQIEYDIQSESTNPSSMAESLNKETVLSSPTKHSENILTISQSAFRGLNVKSGGKLIVNIGNYDRVIFEEKSLNFMRLQSKSSLLINIQKSSLVLFRSKCAKEWTAYSNRDSFEVDSSENYDEGDYNDVLSKSECPTSILFRLNISNVDQVLFEKESFAQLNLFKQSTFQILIDKFDNVLLGKSSFIEMRQEEKSVFELSLSKGNRQVILSESLFADLSQGSNSKFLLNINSTIDKSDSNLCIKKDTFSRINQASNSTLRVIIQFSKLHNSVLFNKDSIKNIKQDRHSLFQIYLLHAYRVQMHEESVSNLEQAQSSIFEIWTSKIESEFSINARSFKSIRQAPNSSIKLGFTSSLSYDAKFIQSNLAFDDFVSSNHSELVYDLSQSNNFMLNFPPRPMPRMILQPQIGNRVQTLEEISLRLYPDLGRKSRPDAISLQNFRVNSNDFCKIAPIPYDVLVKLDQNTECSCSVFYLYRILRVLNGEKSDQRWLQNVPKCYRDLYLRSIDELNDDNDDITALKRKDKTELDRIEEECRFKERVQQCYSINQKFAANSSKFIEKCSSEKNFETFIEETKSEKAPSVKPQSVLSKSVNKNEEDNYEPRLNINRISNQYDFNQMDESVEDSFEDDYMNSNEKIDLRIVNRQEDVRSENRNEQLGSFFHFVNSSLKNTTFLNYFIIGLVSTILIMILVFVIIIVRIKLMNRKHGFVPYISDYVDQDESEHFKQEGVYLKDEQAYNTLDSKQQLIETLFRPKANIYSLVEETYNDNNNNNEILHNNKLILLEYDRKNSLNSKVVVNPQEHQVQIENRNILSIKENPFNIV